jgi:N utilization substance protein B
VAFGVLTVDTLDQALERSADNEENKGAEGSHERGRDGESPANVARLMGQPNALAAQRRKARHFGLQALYQWTLSGASATDIEAEFRVDNDFQHTDGDYFSAVLKGVVGDVEALEALFTPALDRKLDELDPIERNLLRLGTFELRDRIDVPYKVVINEAVALAKKFGATDSHRYINGVLDKIARDLRAVEHAQES